MGDDSRSRSLLPADATRPLGVHESASTWFVGVELCANREGVVVDIVVANFVGDGLGVDCLRGEGDAGDSGRRKGDARGEPYERGDGLYGVDIDMVAIVVGW